LEGRGVVVNGTRMVCQNLHRVWSIYVTEY